MPNEQTARSQFISITPAIWRLGFRPFFLFASLFAAVTILIWIAVFSGSVPSVGAFDPILWHAHEMIYGYATAVIAGFVLTASQNWTGRPGVSGTPLKLLFLLWASARVLMSVLVKPSLIVSILDLGFYPALAALMIPYLRPADMKTERVFFAYFALYFSGNLMMHLEALGVVRGHGLQGALLGLHTTILMIVFMGGRVLPFFAESEKAKAQPKIYPAIEIASHLSAWTFLATQFFIPHSVAAAAVAIAAGIIHFIRFCGWYVKRIRRIAILWVLYSSYLWIVIGFFLSALTSLDLVAIGPSVHALTVGGLGIMTYGMMSRVSLGHTGRKIYPQKAIIAGFFLLNVACAIRVFGPIASMSRLGIWIFSSGVLWVAAFALFVYVYMPLLVRPRPDGRRG